MARIPDKEADAILALASKYYSEMSIKETLGYMISMCSEEEIKELLANGVGSAKSRFCMRLARKDILNE